MRLLPLVPAVAIAVPAVAAPMGNPYLVAAKRLVSDLDYEKAAEQLERARNFPNTTPQEMVEIETYTGVVKYLLGDMDSAHSAFDTALALDPDAKLPDDTSPKIAAEWNTLQQKARARAAKSTSASAPAAQPALAPTADGAAPSGADAALAKPADGASASRSPAPYFVMGGGVVLAAAGVAMGVLANQAAASGNAAPVQVDAINDQQGAKRDAVAANVLYAAAGAALVGGALWWLLR